jgi:putative solute:sodium symporter small subunit
MRADTPPAAEKEAAQPDYWRRTRRFTLWLTLAWFGMTFCTIFFARELAQIRFFGWTLSYYLAAQGATLLYLVLIAAYGWHMRHLDRILKAGRPHER